MEQKPDFNYAAKVLSEARQNLKEILIDFYEENEQLIRRLSQFQLIDNGLLLGILVALCPETRAALEFYFKEIGKVGISTGYSETTRIFRFLEVPFDPIKAIEERRKQREQTQENSGNQA